MAGGRVIVIKSKQEWEAKQSEATNAGQAIVVDFSATWCGPCRMISPYFDELSTAFEGIIFLKVDVDEVEVGGRCLAGAAAKGLPHAELHTARLAGTRTRRAASGCAAAHWAVTLPARVHCRRWQQPAASVLCPPSRCAGSGTVAGSWSAQQKTWEGAFLHACCAQGGTGPCSLQRQESRGSSWIAVVDSGTQWALPCPIVCCISSCAWPCPSLSCAHAAAGVEGG